MLQRKWQALNHEDAQQQDAEQDVLRTPWLVGTVGAMVSPP